MHSRSSARLSSGFRLTDLDVVDPWLLRPPDIPIRSGWRTDAGVVLDRELVRLAGMDARCRLLRARIARRLMDTRGWRPLGFVRLGDYARERLGVSPRTLEEDAHVVRALDRLPALAEALDSGAIGWTRARLLVRVATADNEARLMKLAAAVPTRELEEFLRGYAEREASQTASPPTVEPGVTGAGARETAPDDDPEIRWSMSVSRSGRRMWRAARELASRCAGSALSPAQVLELVAAEAMSAAPSYSPTRWAPSAEDHEQRLRTAVRARERRGRRYLLGFLAETGAAEGFAWLEGANLDAGPARALDALLEGLADADAFELDRRLGQARLAMQRIDYQMAALLRIGIDRRLFREIGFATVKLYAESRLGCSARKVWSLVAIERRSWRTTHLLRNAWREGRITHLAALELLSVISEQHGEAWIRRAGEVTLRRLRDEVAWALDHGQPAAPSDRPAPPELDADVRLDAFGDVGAGEVQMRAHGDPGDTSLGPPGAVRIDIYAPVSVAALVEVALDRLRRGNEARWRTFERMIALALLEWAATPRHRDPVFERDGWRCTVPACSSRRNLHDHHVLFRSHGGDNGRDNRTTVCAAHHLHGIHAGIIRARGRAPAGIVWEMPLMRLLGDRKLAVVD